MDDSNEEFSRKRRSRSVTHQQAWVKYKDDHERRGLPYLPYHQWVLGRRGKVVPFPAKADKDQPPPEDENGNDKA